MLAEQKSENPYAEMGLKLEHFRKKLAHAIGKKNITQSVFGEMFGGYTRRAVGSYERGETEIPGNMLYEIWKSGNSIDALFGAGEITSAGRIGALKLFEQSGIAVLDEMDDEDVERLEKIRKERSDRAKGQTRKIPPKPAGKRTHGPSTKGSSKKS